MSDSSEPSVDEQREALAAAFDRDIDPLAQHAETFASSGVDPFGMFMADVIEAKDLAEKTVENYERAIRQWRDHMADEGRHPACPTEAHVGAFADRYLERGNRPDTVKKKLLRLNKAYEYWQNDPAFPHPHDYNPFRSVLAKRSLSKPAVKEPPRIPIDELAERVRALKDIRNRAIVVAQLKLGLRAGEICNLQLQDLDMASGELRPFYPDLGTHPMLRDRENAVYVPSRDERDGNKSRRPRVLPLDDETRRVLLRWLLIRPDTGEPWVFLSRQGHLQMENEAISGIWTDHFHPEYAETDAHRGLTSHFGRHRFTTYWQVEEEINRELVKYLRGDVTGGGVLDSRGAIDEYIHTYYEDVERLYRERIFKLHL